MSTSDNSSTKKSKLARPFIKWAGGKTQLLGQFSPLYPAELEAGMLSRYIEPFLGGGSVFLDVVQRFNINEARLFDINPELILVYKVVKYKPHALIELLSRYHEDYYSRSDSDRSRLFYQERDLYNAQLSEINFEEFADSWIVRAARMIFLNKTCFNGLFRVNSKGGFNVPFGRYKRPSIVDEQNFLQVSSLLQNAELFCGGFKSCEPHINDSSFVYFDPPYRPLSATASFTSYSKDKFGDDDQIELAHFFAKIADVTKARLMLSNSDPRYADPTDGFFDELYEAFHIHDVYANRMINSDTTGRGKIPELVITNY